MTSALNASSIYRALGADSRQQTECLDVLETVGSTNTWLLERAGREPGRFQAVLAEQQTAGRGRRGNRWMSPKGSGLYLSLAHTFEQPPANASSLTLVAGLATARVLERGGADGIKLKWPNDIYAGDAKLGGILTEAQSAAGRVTVVCGIGINLDLRQARGDELDTVDADYPLTDLKSHSESPPEPSALAAAVIDSVIKSVGLFAGQGFAPFLAEWNEFDWLKDKTVTVDMPNERVDGVADGIDATGALRVNQDETARSIVNGTVRVLEAGRA